MLQEITKYCTWSAQQLVCRLECQQTVVMFHVFGNSVCSNERDAGIRTGFTYDMSINESRLQDEICGGTDAFSLYDLTHDN